MKFSIYCSLYHVPILFFKVKKIFVLFTWAYTPPDIFRAYITLVVKLEGDLWLSKLCDYHVWMLTNPITFKPSTTPAVMLASKQTQRVQSNHWWLNIETNYHTDCLDIGFVGDHSWKICNTWNGFVVPVSPVVNIGLQHSSSWCDVMEALEHHFSSHLGTTSFPHFNWEACASTFSKPLLSIPVPFLFLTWCQLPSFPAQLQGLALSILHCHCNWQVKGWFILW